MIEEIALQVAKEWQMSFDGIELDFALEVAKRAVAAERDACANLCAAFAGELDNDGGPAPSRVRNCAAFIRARSNAKQTS